MQSLSKSTIFGHVMVCSSLAVHRRFVETYYRHLQGSKIMPNKQSAGNKKAAESLYKRRWTSTGIHGIALQMTALFIITAVRTSNPT
jgi:hypothetical protein